MNRIGVRKCIGDKQQLFRQRHHLCAFFINGQSPLQDSCLLIHAVQSKQEARIDEAIGHPTAADKQVIVACVYAPDCICLENGTDGTATCQLVVDLEPDSGKQLVVYIIVL